MGILFSLAFLTFKTLPCSCYSGFPSFSGFANGMVILIQQHDIWTFLFSSCCQMTFGILSISLKLFSCSLKTYYFYYILGADPGKKFCGQNLPNYPAPSVFASGKYIFSYTQYRVRPLLRHFHKYAMPPKRDSDVRLITESNK